MAVSALELAGCRRSAVRHRGLDFQPTVEVFLVGVLAATVRRLVDLVDMYGDGHVPCSIPITQEDLANMAGTTRPSANRCLQDLVAAASPNSVEVTSPSTTASRY